MMSRYRIAVICLPTFKFPPTVARVSATTILICAMATHKKIALETSISYPSHHWTRSNPVALAYAAAKPVPQTVYVYYPQVLLLLPKISRRGGCAFIGAASELATASGCSDEADNNLLCSRRVSPHLRRAYKQARRSHGHASAHTTCAHPCG